MRDDRCEGGSHYGCDCTSRDSDALAAAYEAGAASRDADAARVRSAAEEVRVHIEQNGECELCGADPVLAEDGKVHHDGTVCEALAVALDAKETNHVR